MVVHSYSREMPTGGFDRAAPDEQLEMAVVAALADPLQPRLVFQPIVDLHRGHIVGYETLSRFSSPLLASPDKWFAAADRIGVGAKLQSRVLRRGIELLPTLPEDTFLNVNLDPALVTAPEIVDLLTTSGRLDRLVIELTEQTVARDLRGMLARLDDARAAGAIVAMDDTGAGYASLQSLLTIRPQMVKLDRSLVAGIDRDIVRRSLVSMLGEFVGRLDAWVLGEGIETPEELQTCVDLQVPLGQGWLLGRPADDWTRHVPLTATNIIRERVGLRDCADTLAALLRAAPSAASREEARAAFDGTDTAEHVVIVDHQQRPTAVLDRADAYGDGRPRSVLLARGSETVQDVARRAVARAPEARFDPIICRDERGCYQGIVTVDQLLNALAGDATSRH